MVDQPMPLASPSTPPIVSKEELKDFTEIKYKVNPEPYNRLLSEIAKTGANPYGWKDVKKFICYKAESVIREFYAKNLDIESKEIFEDRLKTVLEPLNHFVETYILSKLLIKENHTHTQKYREPFTLQRICELLINPGKHYKSTAKLLNAFEKV